MIGYFKQRMASFGYAFRGIQTLFRSTPNTKIHLVMALLAIFLGIVLSISRAEWVAIVVVIGLVLALEALNTSIETLADLVCPQQNNSIKQTKDLAAAAVLISSIAALVVGTLVFLPKIINLFI